MRAVRTLTFLSFLVFLSAPAFAAAPPPPTGTTGGTPSCWPPPCIPVDGGIGFLIAAGAVFGAKKLYDHRRKSGPAA